jgi:catechol 2,3-dioxygenase-like lactoylglutathione lyase family enzyme
MIEDVQIHHVAIIVKDIENSIKFYRDVLGLPLLYTTSIKGEEVSKGVGLKNVDLRTAMFKVGDTLLEITAYLNPKGRLQDRLPCDVGQMHLAFKVKNLRKLYEDLKNKGVEFNTPPNIVKEGPMKGWVWVYFKDPDGAVLELVEET